MGWKMSDADEHGTKFPILDGLPQKYFLEVISDNFPNAGPRSNPALGHEIADILNGSTELQALCHFTAYDLDHLLKRWCTANSHQRTHAIDFIESGRRADSVLTAIENIGDLEKGPKTEEDFENLSQFHEVVSPFPFKLPPIMSLNSFGVFVRLLKANATSETWQSELRHSVSRIDLELIKILKAAKQLHEHRHDKFGDAHSSFGGDGGVFSAPKKLSHTEVSSRIVEASGETAAQAKVTLETARAVLMVLRERNPNDPDQRDLMDRLEVFTYELEELASTLNAVEQGNGDKDLVEEATNSAEKAWMFFDQKFADGVKDVGFKTVTGSMCFAIAAAGTVLFSALGFPITPTNALYVSAGLMGGKTVVDAIKNSKD